MKAFDQDSFFAVFAALVFLTVGALFYYTFWAREAYLEMGSGWLCVMAIS